MKKETEGVILAVLAAVISGIAIPLNKLFLVTLNPTVFTAVRAIIIGVVFLAISLYQSRSSKKSFKKVPWVYLLAIAVIGGAVAFLLFFTGLTLTTASDGAFLQKTLPLYVAILAFVFLKEKITRKMSYAIVGMFIGTFLIYIAGTTPGQFWPNPSLGNALIILATILWAIEAVIAKKAMLMGETNFVVSFARMFFGGLILIGFAILTGNTSALLTLSTQQWTNILISTGLLLGYVLFWYWSIRKINVTKATSLLLIAPIISAIGGMLLFGEQIPALEAVGAVLIIVGAYFMSGVKSEFREKI